MTQVHGRKHKLAVIGGGMASLSAVYEITSQPGWDEVYDITVFQTGFRLGGKGASGRNREHADRIEEHGLHIFMGFYENAFRILRHCYEELDRPPGAPLRTWTEAFHAHDDITLFEQVEGDWRAWPLPFPRTAGAPGDGGLLPPMWSYVPMILEAMLKTLAAFQTDATSMARVLNRVVGAARDEIESILTEVMGDSKRGTVLRRALRAAPQPIQRFTERTPVQLFVAVLKVMRKSAEQMGVSDDTGTLRRWAFDALLPMLDHLKTAVWEEIGERSAGDDHARRTWLLMDLMGTNLRGMIRDDLVFPPFPFESVDHLDYKEWLRTHGAHPKTVDSAPVNAIYDLVFARHAGIAAGSALRGSLRMMLAYKGSIFYKMQAGMGDVVFAPMFEVLRRRGVKFRFFHRLDNVRLSRDKRRAAALEFGLQATMKSGGDYEPLFNVKGLPCWPSEPLWEQLVEGERFKRDGVDVENFFTGKQHDVGKVVLELGKDFDSVVLGVSVGALPHVAAEVVENSPKLRGAVDNVLTTATQAAQLWMKPDLDGLGWNGPSPVVGTYAKPFDTWADMTHLVPRESFEPGDVGNIAYFCGHLPDPELPDGILDPHLAANSDTRKNTSDWLDKYAGPLWPRATHVDRPAGLDYDLLVDRQGRRGIQRLEGQYMRASVNPSDRYVLSVPGSTEFRPRTEETNLENLFVTGDWIQNGIQGGCAEAATMAGVQTARAISGLPTDILGDTTAPPSRALIAALPTPRKQSAYIERGGDIVLRGPYAQNGSRLYGFLLPADTQKLTELCDRYLNIGETKYRPLGPFVSLVCADIAQIRALHPEDVDKGYIPEKDVAFWVPVMAGDDEFGVFVPKRVVWFLPYIFVDNAAAAATGREVYGFPKVAGNITFGNPEGPGSLVTVDALAIDSYSPATLVKTRRILEVRRKRNDEHGPISRLWNVLEGAVNGLSSGFTSAARALAADAEAQAVANAFNGLSPSRPTRMVFLKQIRGVGDPTQACYQSIIEATATVTAFRGGGRIEGDYEVIISRLASHPIVSELGLSGSRIDAVFDAWLDFDFDVDTGEVIP